MVQIAERHTARRRPQKLGNALVQRTLLGAVVGQCAGVQNPVGLGKVVSVVQRNAQFACVRRVVVHFPFTHFLTEQPEAKQYVVSHVVLQAVCTFVTVVCKGQMVHPVKMSVKLIEILGKTFLGALFVVAVSKPLCNKRKTLNRHNCLCRQIDVFVQPFHKVVGAKLPFGYKSCVVKVVVPRFQRVVVVAQNFVVASATHRSIGGNNHIAAFLDGHLAVEVVNFGVLRILIHHRVTDDNAALTVATEHVGHKSVVFVGVGLDGVHLSQTIRVGSRVVRRKVVLPHGQTGKVENRRKHALYQRRIVQQKQRH